MQGARPPPQGARRITWTTRAPQEPPRRDPQPLSRRAYGSCGHDIDIESVRLAKSGNEKA